MNRIAEEVERDPIYLTIIHAQRTEPEATGADAIAAAARQIAETLELSAVVCWTSSGSTALRVARERPKSPIVAISPRAVDRAPAVAGLGRALHRGGGRPRSRRHGRARLPARVRRMDSPRSGQRVIIVAGVPLGTPGATNMLRIAFVAPEAARDAG